ncbi:MAG: glycosyltransferase family 4 protein [Gammaproteobacteria bacterium]|nr:glycosyltransferase family 4 protein [Gammaproteobacteria bacterium]MDH3415322.1 glycosyltransferase family 4 protein [Gammaproteobacteria bacterium]
MAQRCIVVEALSALQGGGQTYLRNLFAHYEPRTGERIFAIVPPQCRDGLNVNPAIELIAPSFPSGSLIRRQIWYKSSLPRLLRSVTANVLFCPGGFLAVRPNDCRTAVAFQNMLPFSPEERRRYSLGYMRIRLWLLKYVQRSSFRDADLVIFISRFAKSVIDLTVEKRRGTSVIIPHGLSDQFRQRNDRPADSRLPNKYVLYVSTLDVYKAQIEVIEAWSILRKMRPSPEKLVFVGWEFGPYAKRVRRRIMALGLDEEVLLFGSAPYELLPAYYQHAQVNLFASSCENCPNILLEAMAAGRPVLCSEYQPMPEFGANAVQYFNPYDPMQLAEKLAQLLDDERALADWGERAARHADDFEWCVSAGQTWAALRQLANRPS